MSDQEKIYVGSGVEKFDGDQVEFSLNLTRLKAEAHRIFEYNNEKFIKLKVCKKRETDQYGKTHSVQVDTFKPSPKSEQQQVVAAVVTDELEDDIPF